jgi:tetratricopeptide (TPR) repeat protein
MPWALMALLAVLAFAAYANALQNPFLLDDADAIVANPHIRSLWPIGEVLTAPVQSPVAGRPLISLLLALNYAWGGLSPAGYHAFNLVVLWTSAVVLFAFVRRTLSLPGIPDDLRGAGPMLAAIVAGLWMLHPLQTELVNYATQRSESVMGLLYLGTLYASLRAMVSGRTGWALLAGVLCALGMASKESMATAPVMVLLFDAVFVSGSPGRALRSHPRLYAVLAATWILLAVLIAGGPRSRSAGFSAGVSPWTFALNEAPIIVTYLTLAVWPHPLVADYGPVRAVTISDTAPAGALILVLLVATAVALWKRPRIGFLAAAVFVTLAPTSSIVPIATEVGAERRMYLPLAALVTLAVLAAFRWWPDRRGGRRIHWLGALPAGAAALGLVYVAVTFQRNGDYREPERLWRQTIAAHPHGRAHYNLGIALKARGLRDEALAEYRLAAADHFQAHYAIGFELDEAGRDVEAAAEYREFLRRAGNDVRVPDAWILLGRVLAREREWADAESAFRRALSMRPRNPEATGQLADLLLAQQRYPEAVQAYQAFLTLAPANAAGYDNLGLAFVGVERHTDAVRAFERAMALEPNNVQTRLHHGLALMAIERLDEAIAEYRLVLRTWPENITALDALATALAAQGHRREAIELFEWALRLDPDNQHTRADYDDVLGRAGAP